MTYRKIVKLGRSTLVVSLPKKWVELNRVKWHDDVFLMVQADGSIAIYPEASRRGESREITLSIEPKDEDLLHRKVIACYLSGYSSVRLVSTQIFTVGQRQIIRELCQKLYMRIMDASAKEIRIESLVELSKVPLDTGIRRMHAITLGMCKDSMKALVESDKNLANAVISIDDEVDNFSLLLLRLTRSVSYNIVLANQLGLQLVDCFDYQTVVQNIEHIADCAVAIARSVLLMEGGIDQFSSSRVEPLIRLGHEAYAVCDGAIKSFFSAEVKAANEVLELKASAGRSLQEMVKTISSYEEKNPLRFFVLYTVMSSLLRMTELGGDIAESAINRSIIKLGEGTQARQSLDQR